MHIVCNFLGFVQRFACPRLQWVLHGHVKMGPVLTLALTALGLHMSSTLIGYVVSPAIRHSSFWMLFPAIRLPEILSPSRTRTIFRLAHSTSKIHMRPSWSFIHVGNRLSFLKPEFNGLMNELMHEWMNEWMNERTNDWNEVNEWTLW